LAGDSVLRPAIDRMRDYPRPWAVAGGWAIDLFVGRETRPHADVDIATFRVDQDVLFRHLAPASLCMVRDRALSEWYAGEALMPPVHEVHATWPDGISAEFLLNERDADGNWVFRRDARVLLPLGRAIQSRDDVPYLAPEITLLYKSNDLSQKNAADLDAALALMSGEQVRWLRSAIARGNRDHPWLKRLTLTQLDPFNAATRDS
jgi:hypothetical protein